MRLKMLPHRGLPRGPVFRRDPLLPIAAGKLAYSLLQVLIERRRNELPGQRFLRGSVPLQREKSSDQ